MDTPRKYQIDAGWTDILAHLNIDIADVLAHARLPKDVFAKEGLALDATQYFALWDGLEAVADDPLFGLHLVDAIEPQSFSPPIFAAMCSVDLSAALERLAMYKPIIGPLHLGLDTADGMLSVTINGLPQDRLPPASFMVMELAFLTQLARLGLRRHVIPKRIETPVELANHAAFARWFGAEVSFGPETTIGFDLADAQSPFVTANSALWAAFEPELQRRLSDATAQTSTRDRLRAWLNEVVASGRASMPHAARELGMSTRTLQRRLATEGTSFQEELAGLRAKLAQHYLTQTQLSTPEIAFLLGYEEQNSFYRAFHDWTGASPERVRMGAG